MTVEQEIEQDILDVYSEVKKQSNSERIDYDFSQIIYDSPEWLILKIMGKINIKITTAFSITKYLPDLPFNQFKHHGRACFTYIFNHDLLKKKKGTNRFTLTESGKSFKEKYREKIEALKE